MSGLESTFDLLRSERSAHAESVWLAAMRSDRRFVRDAAFRASLAGAPLSVQCEVLRRWKTYDDATRRELAAAIPKFNAGLRSCLSSKSEEDRAAAVAIALSLRIHGVIPELVHLAEDGDEATRDSAARVVLRLAQSLKAQQLEQPSDASTEHTYARVHGCLEQAVKRFNNHRRLEIVEAFLLLTSVDNETLLAILHEPTNVHAMAVNKELQRVRFETLPDPLVVDFVHGSAVPEPIRRLWHERDDERFFRRFLASLGTAPSLQNALANLKRLDEPVWLTDARERIDCLSFDEQRGFIVLVGAVQLEHEDDRPKLLCDVATHGELANQVEATRRLAEFRTDEVSHLILELAESGPVSVKAEALSQLKDRNLPGAMSRLRAALDSPEEEIRSVATAAFAEYTMEWYLGGFDMMDEEARGPNGQIVLRVDNEATGRLRQELETHGKRTRIRAVQVASTLELLDQVQDLLAALLMDADQWVRLEAIGALAELGTPEARQALNLALADEVRVVRDSASAALQRLVEERPRANV
ncbi:MAG: HEAT repeat domain-containing protein [Pirellulaceae bacterium]|nr:HEAT repeat domain-containing protein [Planctomycetales bacterium]